MTAPVEVQIRQGGWNAHLRRVGLRTLAFLRARIRASELWLAVIAAGVGAVAGLSTVAISAAARALQVLLYGISPDTRLSTIPWLPVERLPILPLGGLALGLVTLWWSRRRPASPVDPVEANALRGGRMSIRDSLFVVVQSLCSNGFGASVGLEAAYAQMGGAIASLTGGALNLRRSDLRTFVGVGAGAGIAAAFNAPLTGAFYAFEIIIGSYTTANIAPVVAAALAGALVSRLLHVDNLVMRTTVTDALSVSHYLLYATLGLVCALAGIAIMRLVALCESLASRMPSPRWARPAIGGILLAAIAFYQPETLSAGHGAMHLDMRADLGLQALALLFLAKVAASVVALGFGYRGGLFFASLYLGSLLGRLFVVALYAMGAHIGIDPLTASLVGMGALAVAIIGGPFTMSFLVLETTGDFGLTAVTLTASIVASLVVRETFGYSFSTWRLHLRGETIRSAHDVGWLRTLTAGRMMRRDAAATPASQDLEEFRRRFPLGSTRRVLALDADGRYAGIIPVAAVFANPEADGVVGSLAVLRDRTLSPDMSIKACMAMFDATESDELAVLDDQGKPIGVLSEAYATRRYAEELEKARRDLVGGDAERRT
ncbi:MAG TPA: chloride channel protein [Caulobacteraceae bacterium]|nr:chloride channel protein [Caulobacteraceae bacterium]